MREKIKRTKRKLDEVNKMSYLIMEQAIIQEAKVVKINPTKAIFRMVMQTADEMNQNRRIYPKSVLSEGMESNFDRIKSRQFVGEIDHPWPSGDNNIDAIRQSTVSLANVSHLIRSYDFDGNKLVGELETAGPKGGDLLTLLRDKVGVGLSMRGMAELDRQENVSIVKSPLMVITFDAVAQPSHKGAIVNFNEMTFESMSLLKESSCGTTVCTPDGHCYLSNYFDKLIETRIIRFSKQWV